MSSTAKKLLDEILQLPKDERERIAEEVWLSLHDEDEEGDVEAAWDEEIKKRLDEIDSGKVEMVPFDEVMSQIEKSLREKRKHPPRSVERT